MDLDIKNTADFVRAVNGRRVALQFPDDMLEQSPRAYSLLSKELGIDCEADTGQLPAAAPSVSTASGRKVAILGDTSYGACCVDEVAAAHLPADCLIHYGHACMSATVGLPVYYVFETRSLDVAGCASALASCLQSRTTDSDPALAARPLLLLWDSDYLHVVGDVLDAVVTLLGPQTASDGSSTSDRTGTCTLSHAPAGYEELYAKHTWRHASPRPGSLIVPQCCRVFVPDTRSKANATGASATASAAGAAPGAGVAESAHHNVAAPGAAATAIAHHNVGGLRFCLPTGCASPADVDVFYIGWRPARRRMVLAMFATSTVTHYNPRPSASDEGSTAKAASSVSGEPEMASLTVLEAGRLMSKRYRYVETVRAASVLGIVAGTLGVARHTAVVAALRAAAARAGKHAYVFVLGKLNPAKLANFAEVDVFVLVACPENTLLESADEYHKPLVSPQEAFVAMDVPGLAWTGRAELDFGNLLTATAHGSEDSAAPRGGGETPANVNDDDYDSAAVPVHSLVSGGGNRLITRERPLASGALAIAGPGVVPGDSSSAGLRMTADMASPSTALVAADLTAYALAQHHSAAGDYLKNTRQWRGLAYDTPASAGDGDAGAGDPSLQVVQGRSGRAAGYSNELM